jgi:formate/nitrite transporter FocA (FNT family)
VRDEILDMPPERIVDRAGDVGAERLDRSASDILVTGVIAGIEVSLGGLAAATVIGTLLRIPGVDTESALPVAGVVFPIGFLFVVMGRSELFTENFLIPVVGVLGGRRPWRELPQLWGVSWLGNVVGCAAVAALLSVPRGVAPSIVNGYAHYAQAKLSPPASAVFVSAVLAGMTMTVLTWLVIALRHPVAKIVAIWAAGYVLFAANLSHAIVGAAMVFTGFVPAHQAWTAVARWLALSTAGNLAGGVTLVTVFRLIQAHQRQRG